MYARCIAMCVKAVAFSSALLTVMSGSMVLARTWTDASGKFSVEADLVDVRSGRITLLKADGRVVNVPVQRLSDDDLAHLARSLERRLESRSARVDDASTADFGTVEPASTAGLKNSHPVPRMMAGEARTASTVQLPTFSFTTVNTTVNVPDRGTVLLGGINRFAEGSVERGVPVLGKIPGAGRLFRNRAIGRQASAGNLTVTARIIDLEEEEFLQTGVRRGAVPQAAAPRDDRAARLARHIGRRAEDAPRPGPAAPAMAAAEQTEYEADQIARRRAEEAIVYFAKARRAAVEGRDGVARVFYDMALRRADGEFADYLERETAERKSR